LQPPPPLHMVVVNAASADVASHHARGRRGFQRSVGLTQLSLLLGRCGSHGLRLRLPGDGSDRWWQPVGGKHRGCWRPPCKAGGSQIWQTLPANAWPTWLPTVAKGKRYRDSSSVAGYVSVQVLGNHAESMRFGGQRSHTLWPCPLLSCHTRLSHAVAPIWCLKAA
jgi:hypothetical protein